jgi:hypothetical protein
LNHSAVGSMITVTRIKGNSRTFLSKLKLLTSSSVSTWSPLATAFNARPGRKLNLSLTKDVVVSSFGLNHVLYWSAGEVYASYYSVCFRDYLAFQHCGVMKDSML